jgi:Ca2+ transporting ATPase
MYSDKIFELNLSDIHRLFDISMNEPKECLTKLESVKEICKKLKVDPTKGITNTDIEARILKYGHNKRYREAFPHFCNFIIDSLSDIFIRILIVASIFQIIMGVSPLSESKDWLDGIFILVAVMLVVVTSSVTNYNKEKRFREVADNNSKRKYTVRRNERILEEFDEENLVVGDIIKVNNGMMIPVDGLVISGLDILVDQSSLSGEVTGVKKEHFLQCLDVRDKSENINISANNSNNLPTPLLYSGTIITNGEGWMVTLATGNNTYIGKISEMGTANRRITEDRTPLELKLDTVAGDIGKFGLIIATLTFIVLMTKLFYSKFEEYNYHMEQYNEYLRNQTNSNNSTNTGEDIIKPASVWDGIYQEILTIFMTCVAIVVVVLPEGLPLAVTLALSFAVGRMIKENNLVRKLHACETMGNANYILTDKTGTITTAEFKVSEIYNNRTRINFYENSSKSVKKLLTHNFYEILRENIIPQLELHIKNDSSIADFFISVGENVKALLDMTAKDTVSRSSFNSTSRTKTTVLWSNSENKFRILKMGAYTNIIETCNYFTDDNSGKPVALLKDDVAKFNHMELESAGSGLRIIAFCYKDIASSESHLIKQANNSQIESSGFNFIGYFGLSDSIKSEIPIMMETCKTAGVNVLMVTGDSAGNAVECAKQSGLILNNDDFNVLDSKKFLEEISLICESCQGDDSRCECGADKVEMIKDIGKFKELIQGVKIFSKFSPMAKGILAMGLRQLGNTVAVIGDGTNDALAFRQADVAFAMGRKGTETCKLASDIIILDDNLSSIVSSIKWGRNIYDNIRKFIQFQLSVNLSAVLLIFISSCVGSESPISAIQMLWINLIMDSLGSLSLATEQPNKNLLYQKPCNRKESIINSTMWKHIISQSMMQFTLIFTLYLLAPTFILENNLNRIEIAKNIENCFGIYPGQKITFKNHETLYYILDGRKSSWDPLRLILPDLDPEYCFFAKPGYENLNNLDEVFKWYNREYGNTVHMTIIFNAFVLFALFNQLNSRILDDSFNIFSGIFKNPIFLAIVISELIIQYLIIEYGGVIFKCAVGGLTIEQWSICIALGSTSLIIAVVMKFVNINNCHCFGKLFRKKRNELNENLVNQSREDYIERGLTNVELKHI